MDVIVDNADATGVVWTGSWPSSSGSGGHNGPNYQHDNNTGKGTKSVRFTPNLSIDGNYEVFGRWAAFMLIGRLHALRHCERRRHGFLSDQPADQWRPVVFLRCFFPSRPWTTGEW